MKWRKTANYSFTLLLGTTLALATSQAQALPAAVIEGVQMPAWIERAGRVAPLAPGMELRAGDELRTGGGSRLLVRLAEGSRVRLGENAKLSLTAIEPDAGGFFKSAMKVLEGAFRFTTDVLAQARRRDVRITVRQVTAGIRGTDLWGKSSEAKQIICLIEGKIEVRPEDEGAIDMDQPRQFYVRENGKSQPIGFVSPEQLAKWAAETEIAQGAGAALSGGRWKLTLASVDSQSAALAVYDRLRAAGYAARILPLKADGEFLYQVRIVSLASRADAEALAARLRGTPGIGEPKVSK
jgi:SPOR domain/FecR protein